MFRGSFVALITPMHVDGSIDYVAIEKLIDWHIAKKTDGLVLLGTTGESPTIEHDERREMIRVAVARSRHKMPVIIGTGANSTAHTILLTQEALSLGADGVLLVTPYYNKPTQEGLFQHYRAIAEAVSIPQILYNVPSRTCCDLLPETLMRLMCFPNIVGCKECSPDIMQRLRFIRETALPFSFFTGDDKNAMDVILAGGDGVISVAANIVPDKIHALCVAALKADRVMAEKIDHELRELYKAIFIETNPIPTKWVLEKMSLIQSGIRLPLTGLSFAHHEMMQKMMVSVGV